MDYDFKTRLASERQKVEEEFDYEGRLKGNVPKLYYLSHTLFGPIPLICHLNTDRIGPPAHPLARSLAPLTRSLALLARSRASLRSLAPELVGQWKIFRPIFKVF